MFELALFPLNAVLFPGMPVSLYVFEEQYRQMIHDCLEQQQPFGVALIRQGHITPATAITYDIGCVAQIVRASLQNEGRLSVIALGLERFRLYGFRYHRPYLIGLAEESPLTVSRPDNTVAALQRLHPWVLRYLNLWDKFSRRPMELSNLPGDPRAFAYLAAHLLQVEAREKQPLLAADTLLAMLGQLRVLYRREVLLLDMMFGAAVPELQGPFSTN